MPKLPFYWIDAFTDKKFGGNPCAVVLDADGLSDEMMQAIAREINLSETAFVFRSEKADFRARYFTPEEELPFAGHPTVATVHTLIESGMLQVSGVPRRVTLELPAGIIPVEVSNEAKRSRVTMSQLAPQFLRTYDAQEIAPIYGLTMNDFLPGAPIQTVSTGSPVLMIPLKDHSALRKVKCLDFDAYRALRARGDFLFPHHFCLQGATSRGTTFARSMGSTPTSLEDPYTGSATGCMAAYLWKYQLVSKPQFIAEQGHWMGRPGEADVEVVGEPESIQTVRVSGRAVSLMSGWIDVSL